jgi:hypothetical protein
MKIISFIEDFKAVDKIVRHLKLSFRAEHPLRLPLSNRNSLL